MDGRGHSRSTRVERWLGSILGERRGRFGGMILALATGMGVGAVVARVFVSELVWGSSLAFLATGFTFVGVWLAYRAPSLERAMIEAFCWTVVPPTVLFAPTLFGLFIAVPAGLLAFGVVAPVVWMLRVRAERGMRAATDRERVAGAGVLFLATLVLLVTDAALAPRTATPWLWQVTAGAGAVLAGYSLLLDLLRLGAGVAIRAGRWRPLEVRLADEQSHLVIERVAPLGDGPHRTETIRTPVTELPLPGERLGLAVALFLASGAALLFAP